MGDEQQDTLPLDFSAFIDALLDDPTTPENEAEEIRKRTPEPALVRAGLFAVANGIGWVVGHQVLSPELIDDIVGVYAVVGPLLLGWWIRRNVVPAGK